jgi:hypothetical protein
MGHFSHHAITTRSWRVALDVAAASALLARVRSSPPAAMSLTTITLHWGAHEIAVGLDRLGMGPTLLLLPALSSISTRCEMRPLQERLAGSFTAIVIDWPSFGAHPKLYVDWRPAIYEAFVAIECCISNVLFQA